MASAELFDEIDGQKFDVEEYIERLAWRALGSGSGQKEHFNAKILYDELSAHVEQLKVLDDKLEKRAQKLESQLADDAKKHADKLVRLQGQHQEAFACFRELDEKINLVAGKVVYLGEQLEATNQPRAHAVEALELMRQFQNFQANGQQNAELFANPKRLAEAADVIRKLKLIAQELSDDKFKPTKDRIELRYEDIRKNLVNRFQKATKGHDKDEMKKYADILSNFKGYQACVNEFVETNSRNITRENSDEIFRQVVDHCVKIEELSKNVFAHPEQVVQKFLQVIYDDKLGEYIIRQMDGIDEREQYLQRLFGLKQGLMRMNSDLMIRLGHNVVNQTFLTKLERGLFQDEVSQYLDNECQALQSKCHHCLTRFYQDEGHNRKQVDGDFEPYNKSLMDRFTAADSSQARVLLSLQVATSILQDTKTALQRCDILAFSNTKAEDATTIFEVLLKRLGKQHILYALDVCLGALPSGNALDFPKSEPNIEFLSIIQEVNTIWHLAEKQFNDDLLCMISSTPSHAKCLELKNRIKSQMEAKCGEVIDRALSLSVGWVRQILKRQRPQDFSESNAEMSIGSGGSSMSSPCRDATRSMHASIDTFTKMLDGDNLPVVLCELGTRYHRCIREHIMSFTGCIGQMGGLMLICDMNAYFDASKKFNVPLVQQLFDCLHALCNLLIQPPDNIRQVCIKEELANLDREVLHRFVQLRQDYRSQNLGKLFS